MLGKLQFYGAISIGLIFVTLLLLDFRKPIEKRNRPQEYSFLVIAGILASCFGVAIDSVTSRISPEYFIYGKGIAPNEFFQQSVAWVGIKAGFFAGVGAAGLLLVLNPLPRKALKLVRFFPRVLFAAVGLGLVFGLVQYISGLYQMELPVNLDENQLKRFMIVWFTHLGVYIGLFAGVIQSAFELRKSKTDPTEISADKTEPYAQSKNI